MSVYVQYKYNHCRPNYIVHVTNNVTFLNIFDLRLVESANAEPTNIYYVCVYIYFLKPVLHCNLHCCIVWLDLLCKHRKE